MSLRRENGFAEEDDDDDDEDDVLEAARFLGVNAEESALASYVGRRSIVLFGWMEG